MRILPNGFHLARPLLRPLDQATETEDYRGDPQARRPPWKPAFELIAASQKNWVRRLIKPWELCFFSVCVAGGVHAAADYLPMWVILMRSLGWTSTPSLNHLPVTLSSDTSHLNTACSVDFTVRSAMLCSTCSSLSAGKHTHTRVGLCPEMGSVHLGSEVQGILAPPPLSFAHLLTHIFSLFNQFPGTRLA